MTGRRLAQAVPSASLRAVVDWQANTGAGATEPPALLSWLQSALVPAALDWWASALSVASVSGPLTFAAPVGCGPSGATPFAGPVSGADFVLRVFVAPVGAPAPAAAAPPPPASDCTLLAAACDAQAQACVRAGSGAAGASLCSAASLKCSQAASACAGSQAAAGVSAAEVLAYANVCARDAVGRPLLGFLAVTPSFLAATAAGLSPAQLSAANASVASLLGSGATRSLFSVVLHEMAHALGFNAASLPLFRRPDGSPYVTGAASQPLSALGLPPDLLVLSNERGHAGCANATAAALGLQPGKCVYKLATAGVTAASGRRFGCAPSALRGAELENQDTTVGATYGSHWESRLFAGELMSPILLFDRVFVSEETLAFFGDSGWYQPNFGALREVNPGLVWRWGEQQGCAFALSKCLSPTRGARARAALTTDSSSAAAPPGGSSSSEAAGGSAARAVAAAAASLLPSGSPPFFCDLPSEAGCTYDARAKGVCAMTTSSPGAVLRYCASPLFPSVMCPDHHLGSTCTSPKRGAPRSWRRAPSRSSITAPSSCVDAAYKQVWPSHATPG